MTVTITLASPAACDAGEILKLIYASSDVGLSATIWDECPVEREECKQIGFLADGGGCVGYSSKEAAGLIFNRIRWDKITKKYLEDG